MMKCSIKLKTTYATRGPGSSSRKFIPYIKIMFLNKKKVFTEKKNGDFILSKIIKINSTKKNQKTYFVTL